MNRVPRRALLTLLALVAALVGSAITPAQAATGTAAVTGTVLDAKKKPVKNRTVTIVRAGSEDFWDIAGQTRTSSKGTYTIKNLPAGSYHLVTDDGLNPSPLPPVYWPSGGHAEEAGTIVLAEKQTKKLSTMTVRKSGTIVASLSSTSLVPVKEDLRVEVYRRTGSNRWTSLGETSTSASGTVELGGLAPGTYRVGFPTSDQSLQDDFWKGSASLQGATDVVVGEGKKVTGIQATYRRSTSIRGVVRDTAGAPLSRVEVDVLRPEPFGDGTTQWTTVATGRTSSTGAYSVGVRPGSYVVRISRAGYVTTHGPADGIATTPEGAAAAAPTLTQGATVDLTAVASGRVSGRVSARQTDLRDSEVSVTLYRDTSSSDEPAWEKVVSRRPREGQYEFAGLAPGRYTVGFTHDYGLFPPIFWDGASDVAAARAVMVGEGQTRSGVDASVVSRFSTDTGSLTGSVLLPEGLEGRPARVVLYRTTDGGSTFRGYWTGAVSAEGRIRVSGLPGGTYRMKVDDAFGVFEPVFVGGTQLEDATDLALEPGGSLVVDPVTLQARPPVVVENPPTVTGSEVVGSYLRVDLGGLSPTAVKSREWRLDGVPSESAGGYETVRLTQAMVGRRVSVVINATGPGARPTEIVATGPVVRPAPVSGVRLARSTPTSVTVDWDRSADLDWESYVVRLDGPGAADRVEQVDTARGQATFTGLHPGAAYSVRVVGTHATGQIADASSAATLSTAPMPSPTAPPKLTSRTKTSATLSWTRVEGAARYRVHYWLKGKPATTVEVGDVTTATIAGLKRNTTYSVRLEAVSPSGFQTVSASAGSFTTAK